MSFRKKTAGFILSVPIFFFLLVPLTRAQSVLDDIKTQLQEAGIEVVDYSTPEDEWGSLSEDWIILLDAESYHNIEEIAEVYDDYFEDEGGITDLKAQLAVAEVEKSRLTLAFEIQEKELVINELENRIEDLTTVFRSDLSDLVSGLDFRLIGEESTSQKIQEGVNLLAAEIDFYYNYNKWGPLPSRIVGILSAPGDIQKITALPYKRFNSLQEIVDLVDVSSVQKMEESYLQLRSTLSDYPQLSESDIDLIIDATKIYIAGGAGEAQVNQAVLTVVRAIQNIVTGIAVLWIIIAGVRMIFADGDENTINEQKNALLYGILGLVIILLIRPLIETLYGAPGVIRTELIEDEGFNAQVYGIIAFLKALVGIVAILFIVLSGVRMLFAQGDEAQITKDRTSLLWVAAGLILVAINEIIIENIFVIPTSQSDQITGSNIAQIINTVGNVMQFLLGFVGLVTLGILVYGAASMILNFGNDEMVERAKKIIRNAVIGILVILSAYVIVASLVVFD